jgi:hypothetical protein
MTDQPKKKQRKTAAQRAQEAYDVATRIADRLSDQDKKARAEATRIGSELAAAIKRRDYLAGHPDLPKQKQDQPSTTSTPGDDK